MTIRDYLISKADEYQNDYLTIAKFGEHNGLSETQALEFIALAQAIRNTKV